jgi:hypothetical protein
VVQEVGVGAAGFLQGIGQDIQSCGVKVAGGELPPVVNGLGEFRDEAAVPGEPAGVDAGGAEGIPNDVTEQMALCGRFALPRSVYREPTTAGIEG